MAVYCYLDEFDKVTSADSTFEYEIGLNDSGQIKLRLRQRNGVYVKHTFTTLQALQKFMRGRSKLVIVPEKIGLVAYFKDSTLAPCDKSEATHCVIPDYTDFRACRVLDGRKEDFHKGKYSNCLSYIRKDMAKMAEAAKKAVSKSAEDSVSSGAVANTTPVAKCENAVFYGLDTRELGTQLTKEATYKIYSVAMGKWRFAARYAGTDRFAWVGRLSFNDQDAALGFMYLYAGSGSLEFFTTDWAVCTYHDAIYCRRMRLEDGIQELHKFDGISWELLAENASDVVEAYREEQEGKYFTRSFCACTSEKDAVYKRAVISPGILEKLYIKSDDEWKQLKAGTPDVIDFFVAQLKRDWEKVTGGGTQLHVGKPVGESSNVSCSSFAGNTPGWNKQSRKSGIADLWDYVGETTWLPKENLDKYITVCAVRNRYIGQAKIFDCRLRDEASQPIYFVDTTWDDRAKKQSTTGLDKSGLKLCMSLPEAQAIDSGILSLPQPLQWSDNIAHYLWNPTIPLAPITLRTMEHICVERRYRLPEVFKEMSASEVLEIVRHAANDGAARACRDPYFALPAYSVEHNDVSMMLPIRVSGFNKNKVIAALLLKRTQTGYKILTLLELSQAARSCSMFCDPDTTWLRGVKYGTMDTED